MRTGTNAAHDARSTQDAPALELIGCEWQRELRDVGAEFTLPRAFVLGVPLLALTTLGSAALIALFSVSSQVSGPALASFALLGIAALPWLRWSPNTDDGPDWTFATIVLAPAAALGVGQWSGAAAVGLGSDLAYLLATFPLLLTALLYVAFASRPLNAGVPLAAYLAYGAPLVAGGLLGRLDIDATDAMTWHMAFALSLAAGYGIRMTYRSNRALVAARETLAWQAAAEDRRRIARDIHDVVAHTLAITLLHVTAARMAIIRAAPEDAREALEEAERHGRASLSDVRQIVRLLRDDASALDIAQPGLADIEALVASYRAAGLPVALAMTLDDYACSPGTELTVYRVLQEALTNAARHGDGPASVRLQADNGHVSLNVANPIGKRATRNSPGSGTLGMRERIAAAGGTLEAGARDGRWIVSAVVPNGLGQS